MGILVRDLADPFDRRARRVDVIQVEIGLPLLPAGLPAPAEPDIEGCGTVEGLLTGMCCQRLVSQGEKFRDAQCQRPIGRHGVMDRAEEL